MPKERKKKMSKEKIHTVQAAISLAGAWLSEKLGILYPVLVCLAFMMVADQVSGMMASKREALDHPGDKNYGWSSKKWNIGIYKKIGYILTVVVGIGVDWIILKVSGQLGITIPSKAMFGLLVSVWFIMNEALSILENACRLGAKPPKFLNEVITVLKNSVEKEGESENE